MARNTAAAETTATVPDMLTLAPTGMTKRTIRGSKSAFSSREPAREKKMRHLAKMTSLKQVTWIVNGFITFTVRNAHASGTQPVALKKAKPIYKSVGSLRGTRSVEFNYEIRRIIGVGRGHARRTSNSYPKLFCVTGRL